GLGGGLLSEGATVSVSNSTFRDNVARGGDGGVTQPIGPRSYIGAGGGMFSFHNPGDPPSIVTVSNSTFEHNQARGGAGGSGGLGSLAIGGGLEVSRTTLTLSGSTFTRNRAVGGVGGSGADGGNAAGGGVSVEIESTATITTSTMSHNQALGGAGGAGANGGTGWGGGLSVATRFLSANPADGSLVTL